MASQATDLSSISLARQIGFVAASWWSCTLTKGTEEDEEGGLSSKLVEKKLEMFSLSLQVGEMRKLLPACSMPLLWLIFGALFHHHQLCSSAVLCRRRRRRRRCGFNFAVTRRLSTGQV